MKRYFMLFGLSLLTIFVSGCNGTSQDGAQNATEEQELYNEENVDVSATERAEDAEVVVDLQDRDGQKVATAVLSESGDAVNIELDGSGLSPGEHGFHIHERGLCDAPDFESAGGHFNPTGAEHGFENPKGPHAGDLENIIVAEDGTVQTTVTANMVTLKKGEDHSLFQEGGTSLVIHADPDDYISQPAGNAGERIACGVISK